MKRRILYVPMHLSTGGSPQWLYELIKVSMLESEVFVAEFNNYGSYNIQKDKIINLVGKKSHECIGPCFSDNWKEERNRLWEIIQEFKPHVIHFNEIPENFEYNGFPEDLLEKIYNKNRRYKILETCHSNSFDFSNKVHIPDGYVCVSEYHPEKIKEVFPDAECYIWDYEITPKERPDRKETLLSLGLDPEKTHILNVGLFHENKNQKFIYEIAEQMLDKNIEFHFIGNDCYLCNCGIENTDLPNCKVWGERNDVDTFYSCMDLFFFPSKRELNPLSVKEAISWGMPVLMNRIESCDLYKKYENNDKVTFIDDVDAKEYIKKIIKNPRKKEDLRIALYTSFYNNARYIPGLYEQIYNQTHSDWKWFVTDDFSKDDTVKSALLDLASRDSRVIYCEQKSKKEMFWNPQHFISEDCDYLALVDADDGIYPKALEFLNHMLKKNPDAFSFSTWFHQYKNNLNEVRNITHTDYSYPKGDWHNYLNKHENDLKNDGFDWSYLRSFRFFGALRGHKNNKKVEIDVDYPVETVYEDSIRMAQLQKYGDYILFPRPMYKVLNHEESHATPSNVNEKQNRVGKQNLYNSIKSTKDFSHNTILPTYYDFFDELCALSRSSIHFEKDRKKICLITNRFVSDSNIEKMSDLYFDHDFCINEFSESVDCFFMSCDSFTDSQLKDIFEKLKNINGDFELNLYCLLEGLGDASFEKAKSRILKIFNKPMSWNHFCRNSFFKIPFKNSDNNKSSKKKVLIELCSSSLGDSIAWTPYAEQYRQENDCEVYLFTYKNDLYRNSYPDITFVDDMGDVKNIDFDNKFRIGWFNDTPDWVKNQEEQRAGSYYLGLKHKEIKPKIDVKNKNKVIDGKYVCISVQSTAQCKYWNNPKGWNEIIKYLNSKGYKVVCIDRHATYGGKGKFNKVPSGAINKTGDFDLQERITDLYHCDFFIGLGSGLSWLAWGVGKDVVLISGFSNEQTEFYTPYRVINKNVCNSCWNRHEFDPNNWSWCPDHEGTKRQFECSKQITSKMVIEEINELLKNNYHFHDSKMTRMLKRITSSRDSIKGWPEAWAHIYDEVCVKKQYEYGFKVNEGDYVVDLGCSTGAFYESIKNKNVQYLGIEAAKQNLEDFKSILLPEDNVVLKHNIVTNTKHGLVAIESNDYDSGKKSQAEALSLEQIILLGDKRKIDFLKFDIEGEEIAVLNDENSYNLFMKYVKTFSGEYHLIENSATMTAYSKESMKPISTLKKLKDDERVNLKIYSVDGIDITESFWEKADFEKEKHNFYTEAIITGKIT